MQDRAARRIGYPALFSSTEPSHVVTCERESVTLMVKVDVPAAVGVPVSKPRVDRLRPAGSEPADFAHFG